MRTCSVGIKKYFASRLDVSRLYIDHEMTISPDIPTNLLDSLNEFGLPSDSIKVRATTVQFNDPNEVLQTFQQHMRNTFPKIRWDASDWWRLW